MINNKDNSSQPLVSIIINCYNGEKYLREAIDSVYSQTYENWEIIFWDNASTDCSADMAKSYDNRLKYFRSEETVSLGKARNWAIEKSNGKYIAFLDCDDVFMPDKLENQVNFMDKNDRVVVCYSDGHYIYNNKKEKNKFSDSINKKFHRGKVFNKLIYINFIFFQTILINRKIAGGCLSFNESLTFAEDHDLLLKLSLVGNFDFIEKPLVYYRIHENNMSRNVDLLLNETLEIIKLYGYEIKKRNIDSNKILGSLYGSIVINLYRQNNKIKAEDYLHQLLLYKSIKNIIIYFAFKFNLSFVFSKNFIYFLSKRLKLIIK